MYLFLDTETTGFPCDAKAAGDPTNAQICQIGAVLMANNRRVVGEINFLIKPNGWFIPDRVREIHGISNEMCEQYGVPLEHAMVMFQHLVRQAQLTVAHNHPFDKRMVCMAYEQLGQAPVPFKDIASYCTMEATTEFCKLPKARGSGYKWPKLTEVYQIAFGKVLDCAHDAMADVRGCAEVYWWWQDRQKFGVTSTPVSVTDIGESASPL